MIVDSPLDHSTSLDRLKVMLTKAIDMWMRAPCDEMMQYANGNAQGIARALAALQDTTFLDEWTAGLDRYQNQLSTAGPIKKPGETYNSSETVKG